MGFHLVQLAYSRDLHNWSRLGRRQTFIGPSPVGEGNFDQTQIIAPSDAVVRGDELWFYYTGLKYRGGWTYVGDYPYGEHVPMPGLDSDIGAICLAVLRRDGFISLDAGETGGTIQTEAFTLPGSKLFVNVDAPKGELRVEARDRGGKVLAASEPMKGDLLRAEVKWQSGDIGRLKGKTVSLRFTLQNASLYSYWVN